MSVTPPRAAAFFSKHARYQPHAKDRSPAAKHARYARKLARAEYLAKRLGWTFAELRVRSGYSISIVDEHGEVMVEHVEAKKPSASKARVIRAKLAHEALHA